MFPVRFFRRMDVILCSLWFTRSLIHTGHAHSQRWMLIIYLIHTGDHFLGFLSYILASAVSFGN